MDILADCRQCGGEMQTVSKENASPLVVQCQACGHREYAEVQFPGPDFPPIPEVEYRHVLVYRNGEKASAAEIQALRKLNRKMAGLPMHQAVKRIGRSKCIDLGVYLLDEALVVLNNAQSQGLRVGLTSPDEPVEWGDGDEKEFFSAPVTVGQPDEDVRIIPFPWILIGAVVVISVLIWVSL